ncbi:MAG TPA: TagF domain-containing protein [Deltaproteobacteria bacterium]|nr:TagF domain-containing protein [Deltaproteobacteria bacterium]
MLGPVKTSQVWAWGAAGKHPVARDYISIGSRSPVLGAFMNWVESGYSKLTARPVQACSYRFWARGARRQDLVCGLLRDSSDAIGRAFPFLVLGTGPLTGWEETWELLPYVLEGIWARMEYLTNKRAYDLGSLERDVALLPHPTLFQGAGTSPKQAIEGELKPLLNVAECYLPLEGRDNEDPADALSLWHDRIKASIAEAPNAIFMGGLPDRTHLALYRRPLNSDDFVRLWSL